jgi:hypothetical protein
MYIVVLHKVCKNVIHINECVISVGNMKLFCTACYSTDGCM